MCSWTVLLPLSFGTRDGTRAPHRLHITLPWTYIFSSFLINIYFCSLILRQFHVKLLRLPSDSLWNPGSTWIRYPPALAFRTTDLCHQAWLLAFKQKENNPSSISPAVKGAEQVYCCNSSTRRERQENDVYDANLRYITRLPFNNSNSSDSIAVGNRAEQKEPAESQQRRVRRILSMHGRGYAT